MSGLFLSFLLMPIAVIFVIKRTEVVIQQMTKSEFVVEVLSRNIKNIYRAQLLIVEKNIRLTGKSLKEKKRAGPKIASKTGKLIEALQNPRFMIAGSDGHFQAESYIALQTRFLDMKKNGNWIIYNRQVC